MKLMAFHRSSSDKRVLKRGTAVAGMPSVIQMKSSPSVCPAAMKTKDGEQVYEAGQPFYWSPGHAPMALEDSEYVDFSPTEEFAAVIRHIKGEA